MARYLVVRLYSMALTLVGLTVLVFLMLHLIPGTVVEQMIGADAVVSQQMVDQLKRFFGLDQPWYVQYGRWLGQLAQGDLGTSWRTGKPVLALILERLPVTLELTLLLGRPSRSSWASRPASSPRSAATGGRPRHPGRHAARPLGAGLLAGHDADPLLLALPPLDAAGDVGRLPRPTRAAISPSCSCPPSASAPRAPPTSPAPPARACSTSSAPTTCAPRAPRGWPAAWSS